MAMLLAHRVTSVARLQYAELHSRPLLRAPHRRTVGPLPLCHPTPRLCAFVSIARLVTFISSELQETIIHFSLCLSLGVDFLFVPSNRDFNQHE